MDKKLGQANIFVLIAAAVMLVGAFMPCYSIFGLSVSAIDGYEGIIVILAAIGVAALSFFGKDKLVVIPGAISAIILIKLCADLAKVGFGSIGIGIIVMWIGTIAAIALPFTPFGQKK